MSNKLYRCMQDQFEIPFDKVEHEETVMKLQTMYSTKQLLQFSIANSKF